MSFALAINLRQRVSNPHATPNDFFATPPFPPATRKAPHYALGGGDLTGRDTMQPFIETAFVAGDGAELHLCLWTPAGAFQSIPLASVFVVHSFASDKNALFELCNRFAAAGLRVISFDLRGHGRSQGAAGNLPIFETIDDIQEIVQTYSVPALPNFLYGHGFGATLVLATVFNSLCPDQHLKDIAFNRQSQQRPLQLINGIILTAPWLRSVYQRTQSIASQALLQKTHGQAEYHGHYSPPPSPIKSPRPVVKKDPKTTKPPKESSKALSEAWKLADLCYTSAQDLHTPTLLIHGDADQFFENIESHSKTLHIWPNMEHEIDRGQEKDEVITVITVWIFDQCRQFYQRIELEEENRANANIVDHGRENLLPSCKSPAEVPNAAHIEENRSNLTACMEQAELSIHHNHDAHDTKGSSSSSVSEDAHQSEYTNQGLDMISGSSQDLETVGSIRSTEPNDIDEDEYEKIDCVTPPDHPSRIATNTKPVTSFLSPSLGQALETSSWNSLLKAKKRFFDL